jgi:hypothetical protein
MRHATAWPRLRFDEDGVISGPWAGGGGVHAFLEAEGYQHHSVPDSDGLDDGQGLDRVVAESTSCPACQAVNGRYEPFTSPDGALHVSVVICRACGHATTF